MDKSVQVSVWLTQKYKSMCKEKVFNFQQQILHKKTLENDRIGTNEW